MPVRVIDRWQCQKTGTEVVTLELKDNHNLLEKMPLLPITRIGDLFGQSYTKGYDKGKAKRTNKKKTRGRAPNAGLAGYILADA